MGNFINSVKAECRIQSCTHLGCDAPLYGLVDSKRSVSHAWTQGGCRYREALTS